MPPHFTRQELSTVAERFLEIAKTVPLCSWEDAKNAAGQHFFYRNHPEEYLECTYRIIECHRPLILGYHLPNIGWPLEVRIHEPRAEVNILLKTDVPISGYTPFATYEDGVIAQVRQLRTLNWRDIEAGVQALIIP